MLRQAIAGIADGDLGAGQSILDHTISMLSSDDPAKIIASEKYAAALAKVASKPGGILSEDLRKEIAVQVASHKDRSDVLTEHEQAVTEEYDVIDPRHLRFATNDLTVTLLLDLVNRRARNMDPDPAP